MDSGRIRADNISLTVDGKTIELKNLSKQNGQLNMEYISKRYSLPIVEREEVGGNCEACRILFSTKELAEKIPNAVTEKAEEIAGELDVLDALGWLNPEAIIDLWKADCTVVEMAPFKGEPSKS